jgi:hypothetical protein
VQEQDLGFSTRNVPDSLSPSMCNQIRGDNDGSNVSHGDSTVQEQDLGVFSKMRF